MIDNNMSTPLLQVRLCIGDSSSELISDATINALLVINENNVPKTCIQSLTAIIADLAKYVNEEVGDTKEWASQRYEHYKSLLDKLTKDPAYLLAPVSHSFGGTSVAEVNRVNRNPDSRGQGIRQGEFTKTNLNYVDINNPFFIQEY